MDLDTITLKESLKYLKDKNCILIDVRENLEFKEFNIGGINIPPHEILTETDHLKKFKTIIVACSNGTRSHIVAKLLQKKMPNSKILHLEEGIF